MEVQRFRNSFAEDTFRRKYAQGPSDTWDALAKLIDDEVEALITEAADRAMQVLKANRKSLEALKNELLSKETIEAEEVEKILKTTSLPASAKLY